ncbi:MAG: RICIN domain-containing protein, partial [Fibrobacter sp.]|nr:RICIN domain-containing protein [Fibrobacter sp.]
MIRAFVVLTFLCIFIQFSFAKTDAIIPGGDWYDTDGNLVAATEGGFMQVGDKIYMWGMDRSADNYNFEAVNCYSSTDMKNWKFENKILKKTSHADLNGGVVVERAKILHNEKNGQFVMWMHYEGHNAYSLAHVACATSPSITEEFTFHEHFRPLDIDSRDINVYKDDDGKGYLISSTNTNSRVRIFLLNENYTGIVKEVFCGYASEGMECEGHGIIKQNGTYFWLMSFCTGWDFNDNHYFYSSSLEGPWKKGGYIATVNTHTYESQVGFAFTLKGTKQTTFVFKGDRWSTRNFGKSRLVVLPIVVDGTSLKVPWHDQWNIDVETGEWHSCSRLFTNGIYTITAKHSDMVLGVKNGGNDIVQQKPDGSQNQMWRIENRGASHFKVTNVLSGKSFDVADESKEPGAKLLQWDWKDSYNQKWHIVDCGDGYHRFINTNTLGKTLEIANSSKSEGASVVLGNFSYAPNQMWRLTAVNEDIVSGTNYMIQNRKSSKVMNVSEAENSPLVQNTPSSHAGQVWKVVDLFNGFYSITLPGKELALSSSYKIENGTQAATAKLDKEKFDQQWQIIKVTDKYYKIINRFSGKALDNKDGALTDNNPVIQYDDNASESTNQQWSFIESDIVAADYRSLLTNQKVSYNNPKNGTIYDLRGRVVKREFSSRSVSNGS